MCSKASCPGCPRRAARAALDSEETPVLDSPLGVSVPPKNIMSRLVNGENRERAKIQLLQTDALRQGDSSGFIRLPFMGTVSL